jgi:hypothetical protein
VQVDVAEQILDKGVSVHPDNDFKDYINFKSNKSYYTETEAEKRNKLMNDCFDVFEKEGAYIFEIMLEVTLIETGLDKVIPLPSSIKEE